MYILNFMCRGDLMCIFILSQLQSGLLLYYGRELQFIYVCIDIYITRAAYNLQHLISRTFVWIAIICNTLEHKMCIFFISLVVVVIIWRGRR